MEEIIRELQRELAVRASVYPRIMAQGKLHEREAVRRFFALYAGLQTLILVRHDERARALWLSQNPATEAAGKFSWETMMWHWTQFYQNAKTSPSVAVLAEQLYLGKTDQ